MVRIQYYLYYTNTRLLLSPTTTPYYYNNKRKGGEDPHWWCVMQRQTPQRYSQCYWRLDSCAFVSTINLLVAFGQLCICVHDQPVSYNQYTIDASPQTRL